MMMDKVRGYLWRWTRESKVGLHFAQYSVNLQDGPCGIWMNLCRASSRLSQASLANLANSGDFLLYPTSRHAASVTYPSLLDQSLAPPPI